MQKGSARHSAGIPREGAGGGAGQRPERVWGPGGRLAGETSDQEGGRLRSGSGKSKARKEAPGGLRKAVHEESAPPHWPTTTCTEHVPLASPVLSTGVEARARPCSPAPVRPRPCGHALTGSRSQSPTAPPPGSARERRRIQTGALQGADPARGAHGPSEVLAEHSQVIVLGGCLVYRCECVGTGGRRQGVPG